MKKRIKKLLYSSLAAFISISINFDTEARLPKYMAQRAAELLIEKSELLKDYIILVNADYEVLMPIISAAVNEYRTEVNSADFFTKVLNKIKTSKEVLHSAVEKLPNFDKLTQEQRVKQIQEIRDRFIVALEHAQIVIPAEKSVEALSEAMKNAVVIKLISDRASNIVDFLYTTEKRQHLANWMKNRIERGQVKRNAVTDAVGTVQHFTNLVNDIHGTYIDDYNFRLFVNQHFPCWTGTMTCFMLNSESHILLIQGNAVDLCRTKLGSTNNAYKIVSILFSLELIDNWNDIKQICKTEVEPDTSPRLDEPPFKNDDPYNCIPVPNTAYEVENIYNGTCLLSATRNLLCILRERDKDFKNLNIKVEVMEYLRRFESFPQLATVPGITNIDEQNRWAGTLLAIRNLHLPDLKGFIDTLIGLIGDKSRCRNLFELYSKAELQKYRDNFNFGSGIQNGNKINPDILNSLITQILINITSEKHKINAQIREATSIDKKTRTWPTLILEIFDYTIKKAIFIGIGNVSRGQHIEILDIKPIS